MIISYKVSFLSRGSGPSQPAATAKLNNGGREKFPCFETEKPESWAIHAQGWSHVRCAVLSRRMPCLPSPPPAHVAAACPRKQRLSNGVGIPVFLRGGGRGISFSSPFAEAASLRIVRDVLVVSCSPRSCGPDRLSSTSPWQIAGTMDKVEFTPGEVLLQQGWPQTKAFFIADGQIRRERVVNDQTHQVVDTFGNTDPDKFGNKKIAIGALHVLHAEPAFANARALSKGHMFVLNSETIKGHLSDPKVSEEVVQSLAVEVRRQANQVRWLMRTPLLEQRPKKTNVIAGGELACPPRHILNPRPEGTPQTLNLVLGLLLALHRSFLNPRSSIRHP